MEIRKFENLGSLGTNVVGKLGSVQFFLSRRSQKKKFLNFKLVQYEITRRDEESWLDLGVRPSSQQWRLKETQN